MQVRASVFANLRAYARVLVVSSLSCMTLAGCASSGAARTEVARQDLHETAHQFTIIAEQRGWAPKSGAGAMSTLLNGRTGAAVTATPTEAYLSAKGDLDMQSLAQAVMVDLGAATDQTQNLATLAEACAANKGDPSSARSDLSAVERALIVAKRVRMVLATAVDRVREAMSPRDASAADSRLAALEAQINRLDKTAGAFADRQRGV